jgi:hypothetical protein
VEPLGAIADDFYVNMHLQTTMDMPQQREAVLHFFEQVQRRFPKMRSLVVREKETFLEEDKEAGSYRWVSADARRLCSGFVNPPSIDEAVEQHREVLGIAPYSLSVSHLDCESLNVVFGFDYTYRGNHNQLLVEALGLPPSFEALADIPGAVCLGYEPGYQFSLDGEMRTQARISFEPRTAPYHLRGGEMPEEQLSVYLALRTVESLGPEQKFATEMERLAELGKKLLDDYMIENILRPLQQAIAIN